jgi:hypothetical protein
VKRTLAFEGTRALDEFAAAANAPIFTHEAAFFGEATVGGPMQTGVELSKTTADVAIRILDGEKAGDIKTPSSSLHHPYSTGAKCGAGELPTAACRPA